MKRESIIIKELAVIDRQLGEVTNETAKAALRKKRDRLKAELKDPGQSANVLAKKLLAEREAVKQLSKVDFNDLIRRLSKKPEYAFLKTMDKGVIRNDIERKAKPVGWRFKGRGNYDKPTMKEIAKGKKDGTVYREVRPRRSDVSFVARLEDGGGIPYLDEIKSKRKPGAQIIWTNDTSRNMIYSNPIFSNIKEGIGNVQFHFFGYMYDKDFRLEASIYPDARKPIKTFTSNKKTKKDSIVDLKEQAEQWLISDKMEDGGRIETLIEEIKMFDKYNYPKPKTKGDKVRAIFKHYQSKGYTTSEINKALGAMKYADGGNMYKDGGPVDEIIVSDLDKVTVFKTKVATPGTLKRAILGIDKDLLGEQHNSFALREQNFMMDKEGKFNVQFYVKSGRDYSNNLSLLKQILSKKLSNNFIVNEVKDKGHGYKIANLSLKTKMETGGDVSGKYCVVMSGGSIGSKGVMDKKGRKLVDTFATREEAAAYAKRRNAGLSPGEKTYYKMKFFIAPYNEKDFVSKMKDGGGVSRFKVGDYVTNSKGKRKGLGVIVEIYDKMALIDFEELGNTEMVSLYDLKKINKLYKDGGSMYADGGPVGENIAVFSVNDETLDMLLHDHHGTDIGYIEISGDTYYTLNRKDFERFLNAADSKGFDVDYIDSQDSVIDVMSDGSYSNKTTMYKDGGSMYAFGGMIDEDNLTTGQIIRMSDLVPQDAEDNMIASAEKVMNDLLAEGFEREEVFTYIAHILVRNVKDKKSKSSGIAKDVQDWSGEYTEQEIEAVLDAYEQAGIKFPYFFVTVAGPTPEADSRMVNKMLDNLPELPTTIGLSKEDIRNISWGIVMAARNMKSAK